MKLFLRPFTKRFRHCMLCARELPVPRISYMKLWTASSVNSSLFTNEWPKQRTLKWELHDCLIVQLLSSNLHVTGKSGSIFTLLTLFCKFSFISSLSYFQAKIKNVAQFIIYDTSWLSEVADRRQKETQSITEANETCKGITSYWQLTWCLQFALSPFLFRN